MAAYFLSPALVRLRLEVNALWPNRSKASDGWIGDTSHAARKSDHNPDYSAGGIVRAIDVTNEGINVDAFVSSVIRDVRTRYVITRGRIWTRDAGWQPYSGANGHYHHVHVSVRSIASPRLDLQAHSWGLSTTVSSGSGGGGSLPTIPGAPAPTPITPKGLFMYLSEEDEQNIYAAVGRIDAAVKLLEGLPARVWGVKRPHPVTGNDIDFGSVLIANPAEHVATRKAIAGAIDAGTARAVAETSAAYHQLRAAVAAVQTGGGASVDVKALADELKTTLGAAVAADLAKRLEA